MIQKDDAPYLPNKNITRSGKSQRSDPSHNTHTHTHTITALEGPPRTTLTEEVGEEVGLVVVHHGHAQRVEAHQAEHGPVEGLRLHHVADEEAKPPLPLVPGGALQLGALQAGTGERRA